MYTSVCTHKRTSAADTHNFSLDVDGQLGARLLDGLGQHGRELDAVRRVQDPVALVFLVLTRRVQDDDTVISTS